MLLTYKELTIRDATPKDASILCAWWNDGTIMAHAGFPNGLHTNVETIANSLTNNFESKNHCFIIEHNGIPIGEMNYKHKDAAIAEIGIKICEVDKQERGNGTLAIKMLITNLFQNGYDTISLDTNENNHRAQHVYEKIGFVKIKTHHNTWKNQLGELQSSIDYELSKENFTPLSF